VKSPQLSRARLAETKIEFWKELVGFVDMVDFSFGNTLAEEGMTESWNSRVKLISRSVTSSQVHRSADSAAVDLSSLKWEFHDVPYRVGNSQNMPTHPFPSDEGRY
jgi:hypothetical protein